MTTKPIAYNYAEAERRIDRLTEEIERLKETVEEMEEVIDELRTALANAEISRRIEQGW